MGTLQENVGRMQSAGQDNLVGHKGKSRYVFKQRHFYESKSHYFLCEIVCSDKLIIFADNFNVIDINSKENFFPNYSMQGKRHPRSYIQQVRIKDEVYSFIAVDACLEPGPRRPFNFVGILDKAEIDELERLMNFVKSSGSNHTIWFGHFPTSCIITTEGNNKYNKKLL